MTIQDISDEELASLFKILSHPIRMRILKLLADGPLSYTSLLNRMETQSTGSLNFHLNKLILLIDKEEEVYRLNETGTNAVHLMESYGKTITVTGFEQKKKQNNVSWQQLVNSNISFLPLIIASILLLNYVIQLVITFTLADSDFLVTLQTLISFSFEVAIFALIIEKYWIDGKKSNFSWYTLSFLVPWTFFELVFKLFRIHDAILYANELWNSSWYSALINQSIDLWQILTYYDIYAIVMRLLIAFFIAIIIIYQKYGDSPQEFTLEDTVVVSSQKIEIVRFWNSRFLLFQGLLFILIAFILTLLFQQIVNNMVSNDQPPYMASVDAYFAISGLALMIAAKFGIQKIRKQMIPQFSHNLYFGLLIFAEFLILNILDYKGIYYIRPEATILWMYPLILLKYGLFSFYLRVYHTWKTGETSLFPQLSGLQILAVVFLFLSILETKTVFGTQTALEIYPIYVIIIPVLLIISPIISKLKYFGPIVVISSFLIGLPMVLVVSFAQQTGIGAIHFTAFVLISLGHILIFSRESNWRMLFLPVSFAVFYTLAPILFPFAIHLFMLSLVINRIKQFESEN